MTKLLRLGIETGIFFAVFLAVYALYQLPDTPTKFIYFNF
ncbi:MAG: hypothetical protein JWR51_68 [Devosia sp.]|nr:hypothetical protein [Devosia sp.]